MKIIIFSRFNVLQKKKKKVYKPWNRRNCSRSRLIVTSVFAVRRRLLFRISTVYLALSRPFHRHFPKRRVTSWQRGWLKCGGAGWRRSVRAERAPRSHRVVLRRGFPSASFLTRRLRCNHGDSSWRIGDFPRLVFISSDADQPSGRLLTRFATMTPQLCGDTFSEHWLWFKIS